MPARNAADPAAQKAPNAPGTTSAANETRVERTSDYELVVTRTFNAPAHIVFEAWTRSDLFARWWVPKTAPMTLVSCDMDVRTGGTYRLVFSHPAAEQPMAFFGNYLEVMQIGRAHV